MLLFDSGIKMGPTIVYKQNCFFLNLCTISKPHLKASNILSYKVVIS